jgi:hypothetical protein
LTLALLGTFAVSTDRLCEEILASDRDNIDSVEWEQKDSQTYIYK